jgi:hypothetical protein
VHRLDELRRRVSGRTGMFDEIHETHRKTPFEASRRRAASRN